MAAEPHYRTLRAGEEEALLELLDGWPFRDGRRGRDFFRRYLEDDPTFAIDNVHVAEERGRLIACAQIFPRLLRVRGHRVPCGGIGSVYSEPSVRGRGVASGLLEAAGAAMAARGLELSLLTSGRPSFYRRFGWHAWSGVEPRLHAASAPPPPGIAIERAAPGADLAAVEVLGDRYAASLEGVVVRDPALWRASARLSGNPDEELWLARRRAELVAFARSTLFGRVCVVTDWGADDGEVPALAALLCAVAAAAGGAASLSPVRDPALERSLAARGRCEHTPGSASWMLRCLAPAALERRFGWGGEPPPNDESLLERLLPRASFSFFVADRF